MTLTLLQTPEASEEQAEGFVGLAEVGWRQTQWIAAMLVAVGLFFLLGVGYAGGPDMQAALARNADSVAPTKCLPITRTVGGLANVPAT